MQLKWILSLIFFLFCSMAYADHPNSPIGLWKTNRSILQLYKDNNELRARVVKVLVGKKQNAVCTTCTGHNKNKPLVGMTVLWGLQQVDDEWTGGHIFDPATGDTYQCKLTLSEDGQTIYLYAYKLIFGRTLEWTRI